MFINLSRNIYSLNRLKSIKSKLKWCSIFFSLFLLFLKGLLYSDLSIYNEYYSINMEGNLGSFTISSIENNKYVLLLDKKNVPYTSFAMLRLGKRFYTLNNLNGTIKKCEIQENNIIYEWKIRDVNVRQILSIVPYKNNCCIEIMYMLSSKKAHEIDLVLLMDIVNSKILDLNNNIYIKRSCVLKSCDEIILEKNDSLYSFENIIFRPDFLLLNNWKNVYKKRNDINTFIHNKMSELLLDSAIVFYWKDLKLENEVIKTGIRLKQFECVINPDHLEVALNEPKTVFSKKSNLVFTMKNNNYYRAENISLNILETNNIEIVTKKIPAISLEKFEEKKIYVQASSLSLIEKVENIEIDLSFLINGKKYIKNFTQDVIVKKWLPDIDAQLSEEDEEFTFIIIKEKDKSYKEISLIIEDSDNKVVMEIEPQFEQEKIFVNSDDAGMKNGTFYYYFLEFKNDTGKIQTDRKVFTTGVEKVEDEKIVKLRFPAVNFSSGSAALKSNSYLILKKIAFLLRDYQNKRILIEGHTDNVGSKELNMELSIKRASAVKDYFVGVERFSDKVFVTEGYGDTKPIEKNPVKNNRYKNRRVEIIVEK